MEHDDLIAWINQMETDHAEWIDWLKKQLDRDPLEGLIDE